MKKGLEEEFNREVEGYRRALLFCAMKSDWEEFKARAGRMFDYLESIEFSEIDRRFFTIFYLILAVLGLAVVFLFGVDFDVHPEWLPLRNASILASLCASSFELYFYLDYRRYMGRKTRHYEKRRERFIGKIAEDFRVYAREYEDRQAASYRQAA